MKKTKQINYYLLIAVMTIKSYLPIIWTILKEDVPFGWYNFFENFRLWRKLIAEKNIQLINFWKDSFWCDLNFYRK
jgi:hypothetical protein